MDYRTIGHAETSSIIYFILRSFCRRIMEEWKPVVGAPLYEVSTHGRVRYIGKVFQRVNPKHREFTQTIHIKSKILNPHPRKARKNQKKPGCLLVGLRVDGETIERRVHHLVLEAFVGPRPPGMEGCHNDGDPTNNRVENLRWDTHKANVADMVKHGTYSPPPVRLGSRHPRTTLTEEQVRYIRAIESWPRGRRIEVAKHLGVSVKNVSDVKYRKTWRHIE